MTIDRDLEELLYRRITVCKIYIEPGLTFRLNFLDFHAEETLSEDEAISHPNAINDLKHRLIEQLYGLMMDTIREAQKDVKQ